MTDAPAVTVEPGQRVECCGREYGYISFPVHLHTTHGGPHPDPPQHEGRTLRGTPQDGCKVCHPDFDGTKLVECERCHMLRGVPRGASDYIEVRPAQNETCKDKKHKWKPARRLAR